MQLEQSLLYKELIARSTHERSAEDLRSRLSLALPTLQSALGDIRVYFRHFTDHSLNHSLRIIRNIESILTEAQYKRLLSGENAISNVDIYLILATALLHDMGMIIHESELTEFAERNDFRQHVKRYASENSKEAANDWTLKGVSRLAVADYVRKHHPSRALQMVLDGKVVPRFLVDGRLGHWIGAIASGHGMTFEQICDSKAFPTRVQVALPSGVQESCNPRFVALCLRLGDLLDINTARVCPTLRSLSEPLVSLSEHHWNQYQDIEIQGLAPGNEISIAGTCPTQDAERLLREWVTWLEREAADATLLQNQDQERYRLHLGRVTFRVEPKKINGLPAYEFTTLRFNLDERMVFERLFGKSLYGRVELALRELIQNAIDAQRARAISELSSENKWTSETPREERLAALRKRIREKRSELSIQIKTERIANGSGEELWLSVQDHGIGMSREAIQNYLLKVGRSRWSNDPSVAELGLGNLVVGAFGVGFLSTLMISDRVVVDTKSCLPSEPGIRVTVYGWQGYAGTQRIEIPQAGTKISLRLNKDFYGTETELARIVAALVPVPDFPLVVVGAKSSEVPSFRTDSADVWRSVAKLDDEGSMVIINDKHTHPSRQWKGDAQVIDKLARKHPKIRLCQDGIAVPEMALPNEDDPFVKLLEQRNLLLDLRGKSRVALDLSRNLVEGGNEKFWPARLEQIWDAIGSRFSHDSVAARAIGDLANSLIEISEEANPLLFVEPEGQILRTQDVAAKHSRIACIDAFRHDASAMLAKDNCAALIIPDTPLRDYGDFTLDDAYSDTESEDFDEDDSRSPSESESRSLNEQGVLLDEQWSKVLHVFPWIGSGVAVPTTLNARDTTGLVPCSSLLGFRASWGWLSVFHPWEGTYRLLPVSSMEGVIERAVSMGLALEDFYLFLMRCSFDLPISEWRVHPTTSAKLLEAASILERSDENLDDNEDSNGELGKIDDDETPLLELDGMLKEWGTEFKGIAKKVGLQESVLTWETRAWKSNAFEGGAPSQTKRRARRKGRG